MKLILLGLGLTLGPTASGLATDHCTETVMSLLNFEDFEIDVGEKNAE